MQGAVCFFKTIFVRSFVRLSNAGIASERMYVDTLFDDLIEALF